jgi:RNA methyltransferase, TrmH family
MILTSMRNPHIQEVQLLKERKNRDESQLFLIEGYRELKQAVGGKIHFKCLYICKEFFLKDNEEALIEEFKKEKRPIYECSPYVFEKISYRDRPDGLIAVAFQHHLPLEVLEKILSEKQNPFLLIAETIEKPGNLGTILRSSDAAGVDAVVLCDACTDLFNPNTVRASVGTLFTQPIMEATGEEMLIFLQKKKISILAATPHAKKEFTQVDLTKGVAIVVGSEQVGLSEKWMSHCDLQVKIPMMGVADSLNVATATTLLLYEVLRQRRSL